MLMRQIETDLRSPMPMQAPMAMQEAVPPTRFDAEQYFAEGGAVHMAEGGPFTARSLAERIVAPEEQGMIDGQQAGSPSWEGIGEGLRAVGEGVGALYATPQADEAAYTAAPTTPTRRSITPAMLAANLNPEAQGAQSPSTEDVGKLMVSMGEDPAALIGGMLPGIGNVLAAADVSKLKDKIAELRASGDEEGANRLQKILPIAAMGAVMPVGGGLAARSAIKAGETAVARAAERELSNMGLYSHGAETALGLPQAKGTPQQYSAMLQKAGVKPAEMEGFGEAFAGRPSVTRDEIAAHFKERMPQIEETVLGDNYSKLQQLKDRETEISSQLRNLDLGHDEWLALRKEGEVVQNKIDELSVAPEPKFSQYSLPGGENYREVLLKSPHVEKTIPELEAEMGFTRPLTNEQQDAVIARWKQHTSQSADYQSSHWDDPNVLAHLRLADRTGPNGEKILHVEEIQSDWGQQGKKEGFKVPLTPELESSANAIIESKLQPGAEFMNPSWRTKEGKVDPRAVTPSYVEFLEKNGTISPDEAQTLKVWNKARGFDSSGVPPAPYVTNTQAWTDLALKRALKEAAEGGYDKLVWTPGAEQAKRYSLSNQVDRLQYIKNDDGTYAVIPYKGGRPLHQIERDNIPDKELESLFGRDVAEKMRAYEGDVDGNARSLAGQNLEVGGEGMKGYYDKIVPKRLQELIKKHDPEAKIGFSKIEDPIRQSKKPPNIEDDNLFRELTGEDPPTTFGGKTYEFPSLTITPKMRESILKGQTAFAEGGEVEAPKAVATANLPEQVALVAHDIARIAHKDRLDQRHLAYLLKAASGMNLPPERAMEFAQQIMTGDAAGLMQRFQTYVPSARTFARLNEMMGGKHDFMGKGHMGKEMQRMKGVDALQRTKDALDAAMDSDVVRDRPAMTKALKRLSKGI